jgi:glutamate-1-semialdehyde aminotransferase
VTPDLACLGKALGNGVPIAAVAGNRALMGEFDRVFVSSTFGGDAIGLAAAKAVLDTVATQPVVPHLWELGARWLAGARAAVAASGLDVTVGGAPPRSHVAFAAQGDVPADAVRSLWLQECVRRGILFGVPIFMSFGHTAEDVDRTLTVFAEALGVVTGAVRDGSVLARLDGPPVEPIARPAAPGAPAMPLRRVAGERRR